MKNKGNLFFALMYKDKGTLEKTIDDLKNNFDNIIKKSRKYDFSFTDYYEKEFGNNLKKTIIVFNKKINKKDLLSIKKFSTNIENKYSINSKRKINIDPGYLNGKEVALASSKAKAFKENLGNGVYLHKVLEFKNGKTKSFWHTFEDYKRLKNFYKTNRLS